MFSVRLFIAVAGVLLMSDANQPEATTRQGRLTNPDSQPFLVNASNENEGALSILAVHFTDDPTFDGINKALFTVQRELNKLIEGTVENRPGSLLAALGWEFFGYFYRGQCTDNSKCKEVSGHVQRATAKLIAAFLKESIDETLKSKIKDIISGNITENGDIEGEASVQQTYTVGKAVQYALY